MGDSKKHKEVDSFDDFITAGEIARDMINVLITLVDSMDVPVSVLDTKGAQVLMNDLGKREVPRSFELGDTISEWEPLYWRDEARTLPYEVHDLPASVTLKTGEYAEGKMWVQWEPEGPVALLDVTSYPVKRANGTVSHAIVRWPTIEPGDPK